MDNGDLVPPLLMLGSLAITHDSANDLCVSSASTTCLLKMLAALDKLSNIKYKWDAHLSVGRILLLAVLFKT